MKNKNVIIIIALVILVSVLVYRWNKSKKIVPAKKSEVKTPAPEVKAPAPVAEENSFDGSYGGVDTFEPTEGIYGSYNGLHKKKINKSTAERMPDKMYKRGKGHSHKSLKSEFEGTYGGI